ncbi:MAG: hypothetical protein NTV05_16305 [Acidobacteria bacterium]|nr:hypothetical protein [Acidobacteriota bacterium]
MLTNSMPWNLQTQRSPWNERNSRMGLPRLVPKHRANQDATAVVTGLRFDPREGAVLWSAETNREELAEPVNAWEERQLEMIKRAYCFFNHSHAFESLTRQPRRKKFLNEPSAATPQLRLCEGGGAGDRRHRWAFTKAQKARAEEDPTCCRALTSYKPESC